MFCLNSLVNIQRHAVDQTFDSATPVQASHKDMQEETAETEADNGSGASKRFDFLVIGSGVAGLRYALAVAKFGTVAIVTKSEPQESNTMYAQGGVSAVLDPADSVESHIRDTIVAGAFLCDEETVEVVCREGPERVRELIAWGALFDQSEDGQLHLAREGGHSHHRIVHAADMTGREIERALLTAVQTDPNISMFEHHVAVDLLTLQDGPTVVCYGVDTLDTKKQKVVRFIGGVTMLASGGAGHVYPTTTNPLVATGDGVALAQRAHAVVSNMEFVQFHPTALADEGLPIKPEKRENAFLITEAMRGAGGILYNQSMERFMPLYDSRAELAPRDMVARSIDDQLKKRKEKFVYLDISHKPRDEILAHFPNIAAECLKYGLDITKEPIPVVPAAHYMCGGVQTGLLGETTIQGLFAAGEVTCTGLHGANRLASNSLLEALVFAERAVEPSVAYAFKKGSEQADIEKVEKECLRPVVAMDLNKDELKEVLRFTAVQRKRLQQIMWDYVGIVRSTERLKVAQRELTELEAEWEEHLLRNGWKPRMVSLEVCEMQNLISVSNLVVSSALVRQESRGLHYTTDFPMLVESARLPTILFPSSSMTTWSSKLVRRTEVETR
jgi:L-aspartate oxidase